MNELLMQRCVDGELSPMEQRDFLHSIGEEASHWKRLACQLLEDRALARGCRDWLADPATTDVDAAPHNRVFQGHSEESQNGHISMKHAPAEQNGTTRLNEHAPQPESRSQSRQRSRTLMPVCTAVVGILLGVWLGSIGDVGTVGVPSADKSNESPEATDQAPTLAAGDTTDRDSRAAFNTLQLSVNTPDGPKLVELPVLSSDSLANLASMQSSIPPELQAELSRHGIELSEFPGVITLPIDDATRLAVPVQAVQMRHIGL